MKHLISILFVSISAISSAQIPTSGLIGYWAFTGNANDASGHNYNGNVRGAILTSDRFGNSNSAYEFSGSDYIVTPYITPFVAQSHTFSCWMKSNQTTLGRLVVLPTTILPNGQGQQFSLNINFDSSFAWASFDDVSHPDHSGVVVSSTTAVNDNRWHHVAGVIDSSNHELRIYVDGCLQNTTTYDGGPTPYAIDSLHFGRYASFVDNADQNYIGVIDEVCIYNRVLDAEEIQQLFCNQGAFSIISADGPTTVCKPSVVTLSENSAGCGFTYQWKKGNTTLAGKTNSTYSATTTGTYKCVVTNACGSATSNSVSVTVNPQPSATISHPDGLDLCGHSSLLLQANTGVGLTYQWLKNNIPISGATNSSYNASTKGTYKVIVTNANLCSKTSAVSKVVKTCREESAVAMNDAFSVFPNPSDGKFSISLSTSTTEQHAIIEVLNEERQVVVNKEVNVSNGILKREIDLPSASNAGIYLVRVRCGEEVYLQKIIVE